MTQSNQCLSQVLSKRDIHPGIQKIKTKQYSGSGGSGYWNMKYYDNEGRMITEELYKKRKLMGKHLYEYDQFGNETMFVSIYDINNPNTIDTISITTYQYGENGEIIEETSRMSNSNYTIKLISNNTDSVIYRKINEYNWIYRDTTNYDTIIVKLILNENNNIVEQKKEDVETGEIEITKYQYYSDGTLQRRTIKRIPEPEFEITYTGGPGSDDMIYEYKYDRKKRIKKLFTIIDGKKYKLAKYKYYE